MAKMRTPESTERVDEASTFSEDSSATPSSFKKTR